MFGPWLMAPARARASARAAVLMALAVVGLSLCVGPVWRSTAHGHGLPGTGRTLQFLYSVAYPNPQPIAYPGVGPSQVPHPLRQPAGLWVALRGTEPPGDGSHAPQALAHPSGPDRTPDPGSDRVQSRGAVLGTVMLPAVLIGLGVAVGRWYSAKSSFPAEQMAILPLTSERGGLAPSPDHGPAPPKTNVRVLIVVGPAVSGFTDAGLVSRVTPEMPIRAFTWEEVLQGITQKVKWEAAENETWDATFTFQREDEFLANPGTGNVLLGFGLHDEQWDEILDTGREALPSIRGFFECSESALGLTKLGVFERRSFAVALQALLFPGQARQHKSVHDLCQMLVDRKTGEDLFYCILVIINAFCVTIPFVDKTLGSNFATQQKMVENCKDQIVACAKSKDCRQSLTCLMGCVENDQVCSYRCITSYECREFADFALCTLQKNNLLGLNAQIPKFPEVSPMQQFRGHELSGEASELIFRGWLGADPFSWLVVAGVNPAYDFFPAQHQIFYNGKARGSFWYDPVFLVETLDGRREWRRRNYRCIQSNPGEWMFSTLDNGVISSESWRIVDAADDLSYAVFYYKGAARVVGQRYRGAVVGSRTGRVRPEDVPRIEAALLQCGCLPNLLPSPFGGSETIGLTPMFGDWRMTRQSIRSWMCPWARQTTVWLACGTRGFRTGRRSRLWAPQLS